MTVPYDSDRRYPQPLRGTIAHVVTLTLTSRPPANDAAVPPEAWLDAESGTDTETPAPPTCPTCGQALFALPTSMLLDLALLLHKASADLKAALERQVGL